MLVRNCDWVTGLFSGDLGTSAAGRPVTAMLSDPVGNSTVLVLAVSDVGVALLTPRSRSSNRPLRSSSSWMCRNPVPIRKL